MSTLDERLAQRTSLGTWTFDNRFEYRAGLGRIFNAYGPVICELCYYITSPGGTFTLRSTGSVSYEVDWGDGSSETSTSNALAHTYAAGDYIIRISSAVVYRPLFNNSGDEDLITEIHTTDIDFGDSLAVAWYGANNMTNFNAAFNVTAGVTTFNYTWYGCNNLTSFPLIDTSSGTTFINTWFGCIGLTSFPLIDVSSGTNFQSAWEGCNQLTTLPTLVTSLGQNFSYAWRGCTGLTSFPLINTSSGTNFINAWRDCSSLTSFPLIDTSSGTTFSSAWQGCSGLTSFPLIDTSSGDSFSSTWRDCTGLTSFPLIDTSSGTSFAGAWQSCTNLTTFPSIDVSSGANFATAWYNCNKMATFPANFFDSWTGTPTNGCFNQAWDICSSLTATSVENILNSIDTSGQSAPASGVDITIDYNAGSGTPSVATAVTNLKSRGWTITLNGVAQ